jgi:NAD(P)-dependent dehydrogenase (short-subunit alcohol dehydrogenase family)
VRKFIAKEMIMNSSVRQKTALVTGATSGIGYQVALDLARAGARVIGTGRDTARCQRAHDDILQAVPDARVDFLCADLSSLRRVRELAGQADQLISSEYGKLDLLVNNAGLYASAKKLTEDGLELTFAVNHLAPFLLTHLMLPVLERSPDARVLTVSSKSHYRVLFHPRFPYQPLVYIGIYAYAVSKLCTVLFSSEFNRRVRRSNMHAWAVDPGLVNTNIGGKDGGTLSRLVWNARQKKGTHPDVPSRTILHLGFAPLEEITPDIYWWNSRPKPSSRLSRHTALARDLWEESCRLCGIDEYFPEI